MADRFVRLPNAQDGHAPYFVDASKVAVVTQHSDGTTIVLVPGLQGPILTTRSVQGVRSAVMAALHHDPLSTVHLESVPE